MGKKTVNYNNKGEFAFNFSNLKVSEPFTAFLVSPTGTDRFPSFSLDLSNNRFYCYLHAGSTYSLTSSGSINLLGFIEGY